MVGKNFGIPRTSSNTTMPPFSIVHPQKWRCVLLNTSTPFTGHVSALNHIGERIRAFRENRSDPSAPYTRRTRGGGWTPPYYHTRQYNLASSFFSTPRPAMGLPQWSIFGLPHPYQFRTGDKLVIIAAAQPKNPQNRIREKDIRDRRKSPLHIRIVKWNNNYSVIAQKFEAQFVDRDILFQNQLNKADYVAVAGNPSYTEIDNFINSLAGSPITL